MSPLWRKELRAQRSFFVLNVLFVLVSLASELLKARPMTLGPSVHGLMEDCEVFYVFAFAIGTGLLVREEDDGTLVFLDGLPTTRSRLFIAKLGVASLNLLVYPVLSLPIMLLLQAAQWTSHAEWNASLLVAATGLFFFSTMVPLSLGMALGYLRRLAWAGFGLLVCLVVAFRDSHAWIDLLAPRAVVAEQFIGTHWVIPTRALLVQSGVGILCLAFSYARFSGRLQIRAVRWTAFASRPIFSVLVMAITAVALTGGFYLLTSSSGEKDEDAPARPPPATAHTRHYDFSYPGDETKNALQLIAHADAIEESVTKVMRLDPSPTRIEVDGSGSSQNTSGTTYSTKIRIALGTKSQEATLAHETAHVFEHATAHFELPGRLREMVALDEGMAQWVENQVMLDRVKSAERLEWELAALQARHQAVLGPLMDTERFDRTVDQNLKYPLGELFIQELVRRYGPDSPTRVLRTLGEDSFPSDLKGQGVWQAALQLSGFDLALVLRDCERRALQALKQHRADVEALPRLRAQLVRLDGHTLGLRLLGDRPFDSLDLVVRIRPDDDSPLSDFRTLEVDGQRVAWIDPQRLHHQQVCFQSGIEWESITLYEPWDCVPIQLAEAVTSAQLEAWRDQAQTNKEGLKKEDTGSPAR